MVFDPLSWAIGFSLTKSVSWLSGALGKKTLQDELEQALRAWAAKLPDDASVEPAALFPDLNPDSELIGRPALGALRSKLRSKLIPNAEEWLSGFVEQWQSRRRVLGTSGQPLFKLPESKVRPLLQTLAEDIYRVCVSDEPLFKGTVLAQLDEILALGGRSNRIALPLPLKGPLDPKLLALAVESETGSCVHVVLYNAAPKVLHVWGVFSGATLKDFKWTLATAARLACRLPDIQTLVLGMSAVAELPRTDGAGPVGPMTVSFDRAKLDILAGDDEVPLTFWETIMISTVDRQGTTFEVWEHHSFRRLEEQG